MDELMRRNVRRFNSGFTLVELLIVIVVIAILAAISVVAYNGIQSRANDSTVRSDIAGMAKRVKLIHAETGNYPAGGRSTTNGTTWSGQNYTFPGFTYSLAKQSYGDSPNVLAYCTGPSIITANPEFRILAKSKSGRFFEYSTMNGLVDRGTAFIPIYEHLSTCDGIDTPRSYASAYNSNSGVWAGWTD